MYWYAIKVELYEDSWDTGTRGKASEVYL